MDSELIYCSICKKIDHDDSYVGCEDGDLDCQFRLCDECEDNFPDLLFNNGCIGICYKCSHKNDIEKDDEKFKKIKDYCIQLMNKTTIHKHDIKKIIDLLRSF